MASRHLARSIVMQTLYEWDFWGRKLELLDKILERNIQEFGPGLKDPDFARFILKGVITHLKEIDEILSKAAPEWPLEQIAPIDRNILRIGIFELLYANKEEVPSKVAINEAIELAKSFGGENSRKFVNGVLGTVFKGIEATKNSNDENKNLTENN